MSPGKCQLRHTFLKCHVIYNIYPFSCCLGCLFILFLMLWKVQLYTKLTQCNCGEVNVHFNSNGPVQSLLNRGGGQNEPKIIRRFTLTSPDFNKLYMHGERIFRDGQLRSMKLSNPFSCVACKKSDQLFFFHPEQHHIRIKSHDSLVSKRQRKYVIIKIRVKALNPIFCCSEFNRCPIK